LIRYVTAILFTLFVAISLYLDRYGNEVANATWYALSQFSLFCLCAIILLWVTGWFKVVAFACLALVTVELVQELLWGNTSVHISDNVSLIIVIASVVGFILLRRYKRKL
jgi:hypothetical protein